MGFFEGVLKRFTPAVWTEKPLLSATNQSIIFEQQGQMMAIVGCKEKPNLEALKKETSVRIRFIDQTFILVGEKNKTNDEIIALRKKKESRDFMSWFSQSNPEEEKRLRVLESKQKDQGTYKFPYLIIVSSKDGAVAENRAATLAEELDGELLTFETLMVAYDSAAWDQCKEITSVGR